MLNIPKWKIAIAIVVCIYSIIVLAPNFSNDEAARKVNLGLDLQGGAYLLLEIDQKAYFEEKIDILKSEVRNKLRTSQIGYLNLIREEETIKFSVRDIETNLSVMLRDLGRDITISQQGLDAEISYSDEFIKQQKIKLLEQSLEIVRRRIDETGTKEPLIQPQGLNRIILQVPGIKDPERARKLLQSRCK